MMAVMLLGMRLVHSYPSDTEPGVLKGRGGLEPRTHSPIVTGGNGGIPAMGEQKGSRAVHETSLVGQDESATLWILQQTWQGMEEMPRTFLLEMEEMKRTFQLDEEGMQETYQPQISSQGHIGEVWKPGDGGPILARVGGANLPADGGGTASSN
jgi:hypothetical protein